MQPLPPVQTTKPFAEDCTLNVLCRSGTRSVSQHLGPPAGVGPPGAGAAAARGQRARPGPRVRDRPHHRRNPSPPAATATWSASTDRPRWSRPRRCGCASTRRGAGVVQADGAALPFRRAFDAVFSGATFHWILDHAALFRSIITALKPGGRLVAQCGGGRNLALLRGARRSTARASRASRVLRRLDRAVVLRGRRFDQAPPDRGGVRGHRRLSRSGADAVRRTPRRSRNSSPPSACAITSSRCPPPERKMFLSELTVAAAADPPPFTLDYWRLNIAARRPA